MKQYCRAHLASIEFVGAVKSEDLAEQLSRCDIMVLPSRWENFPFACWESMAAGRAVVGSVRGGMADVIEHGKSGLLVEPNRDAIVATCRRLLNIQNKYDH